MQSALLLGTWQHVRDLLSPPEVIGLSSTRAASPLSDASPQKHDQPVTIKLAIPVPMQLMALHPLPEGYLWHLALATILRSFLTSLLALYKPQHSD